MAEDLDLTHRFDGAAAWADLPEAVKVRIGGAVLSRLVAGDLLAHGAAAGDDRYVRLGTEAERQSERELDLLLEDVAVPGLDLPAGAPRVPALLGPVCRRCGCTEDDGCPGGCGWAGPDLCTACASAGAAAGTGAVS